MPKGQTNNPRGRPPKPPGEAMSERCQIKLRPSEIFLWAAFLESLLQFRQAEQQRKERKDKSE